MITQRGLKIKMFTSRFYKLKIEEQVGKRVYTIPKGRSVPFVPIGTIDPVDVKKALDFAYEMAYGKGHHRDHRQGGHHKRTPNEIFASAFQGKLAEYVVYYCLSKYKLKVAEPDLSVYGENIWDSVDIDCNGRHLSIKSTKKRGQLLLLEKGDWDEFGRYIPNTNNSDKIAEYDYHILVRIDPSSEDLLRDRRLRYGSELPEDVIEMLLNQKWTYCMPRYITGHELSTIIKENFVLKAGDYFNKTKMDADNYYVKAYDMHELSEIIEKLS